jgi:succinyl-CoA synthetase alpha subunit
VSIFVDEHTKVLVQGLTGSQGRFHGLRNRAYGTQVVAGVTPGKGGQDVEGIPIFDTVAEAVQATGANASFVSVPPRFAAAAILEAAEGGIPFIVCISEGIPAHDEARVFNTLAEHHPGTRLLGPNCPGIISPGKTNIGITAGEIALPGGPVGIVSRSGTLTYQALYELKELGIGVTTCVGIGGDPVPGTNFVDCLRAFQDDPETKAIIMFGEIGGTEEEKAADPWSPRRWAMPAPSSRAPRAPPRRRWRRSPPPASTSSTTRPRPASRWPRSSRRCRRPSFSRGRRSPCRARRRRRPD